MKRGFVYKFDIDEKIKMLIVQGNQKKRKRGNELILEFGQQSLSVSMYIANKNVEVITSRKCENKSTNI